MKDFRKLIILILFTVFIITSFNCDEDLSEMNEIARLEEMENEILAMISDLSCNEISDCKLIPFGAKPCGGPWKYLIYSDINVDSAALSEKVNRYNEYNETLNKRYGWVSDCSVAIIPEVENIDGSCTVVNQRN